MAKRITAISTYRPELERKRTMQTDELIEKLIWRTALSRGAVRHCVQELRDELLEAHRGGQAVKVQGLGLFTPTLRTDGTLDIVFRPDAKLLRELNHIHALRTPIVNRESIGKSVAELAARWDAEHPDDPVED